MAWRHGVARVRPALQLHFLSNGTSKGVKTVVAGEDLDGQIFKNASP